MISNTKIPVSQAPREILEEAFHEGAPYSNQATQSILRNFKQDTPAMQDKSIQKLLDTHLITSA